MFPKPTCDGVVLWSLNLHGVRPLKHVRTCWHASAPTNRKCASQGTDWTMPARSEGHETFSNSPPRALTLRCVVLLGVVRLLHTRLACHRDLPLQNVLAVLIIVINTALLAFFFYVASRKFWPSVIRRVTPKSLDKRRKRLWDRPAESPYSGRPISPAPSVESCTPHQTRIG